MKQCTVFTILAFHCLSLLLKLASLLLWLRIFRATVLLIYVISSRIHTSNSGIQTSSLNRKKKTIIRGFIVLTHIITSSLDALLDPHAFCFATQTFSTHRAPVLSLPDQPRRAASNRTYPHLPLNPSLATPVWQHALG